MRSCPDLLDEDLDGGRCDLYVFLARKRLCSSHKLIRLTVDAGNIVSLDITVV